MTKSVSCQLKKICLIMMIVVFALFSLTGCMTLYAEEGDDGSYSMSNTFSGIKAITIANDEASNSLYVEKTQKLALEILVTMYGQFGAEIADSDYYYDSGVLGTNIGDSNVYFSDADIALVSANNIIGTDATDSESVTVWGVNGGFTPNDSLSAEDLYTFVQNEMTAMSTLIISAQLELNSSDEGELLNNFDSQSLIYAESVDHYGYSESEQSRVVEKIYEAITAGTTWTKNGDTYEESGSTTFSNETIKSSIETIFTNTEIDSDGAEYSSHPYSPRYYIEDIALSGSEIVLPADDYVALIIMPKAMHYYEYMILELTDLTDESDVSMSVVYRTAGDTDDTTAEKTTMRSDTIEMDEDNLLWADLISIDAFDDYYQIDDSTYSFSTINEGLPVQGFVNNTPAESKILVGDNNDFGEYFQIVSDDADNEYFEYYDEWSDYLMLAFNNYTNNYFGVMVY